MADGLIDLAKFKAVQDQARARVARSGSAPKLVTRARIHLIRDQLKEAEAQGFTIRCDEAVDRGGGGSAPTPLGYFISAIGF